MRRPALTLALSFLAAACEPAHEHGGGETAVDEYFYDCEDPARPPGLAIFATDESLRALLDKEYAVTTKDENAARLTAPASGAVLSAAAPPTFVLAPPGTQATAPAAPVRWPAAAPPPRRVRLRDRVLAWLRPIGVAHAHCKPVTGDNYLLRLSKDGESKPAYSALASVTSFTPAAATWTRALASRKGQTLRLTLLRAYFTGGSITDGPFVHSAPISFTVE